jgi:3-deoxy-D-manno-octulosonic-acid transferase
VFFRWYGKTYAHVLKCFTHFFVQNEESKRLLASIGITNVDVTGDTRFDRVATIANQSKNIPAVATFVKNNPQKVFVAGSSWLPDEQIFLPYLAQHPEWKIIIAPHVIAENHIEMIMQLLKGRRVMRYSQLQVGDHAKLAEAEVLIIDCFGLLSSIYKYGTVAYVGGGFGVSIHNLPEAAVWNIPVIFGPNNHKFQEAQALKQNGGFEIHDYEEFERQMNRFASDAQYLKEQGQLAGQFVKGQAGATAKVLGSVTLP